MKRFFLPVHGFYYVDDMHGGVNLFFRFVSKLIWLFRLFRLFRYRFETRKQSEKFNFWFHETSQKSTETGRVLVCFGSNRNFFCFVDTLVFSFISFCFKTEIHLFRLFRNELKIPKQKFC
jgi:hypothetical protein